MKWINYHHLIYFKEIATYGSISKASKVLNVGQPALSTQLKNLEEYLGVDLFERKNKRLILTDAGKVTLEYATKISSLGQELIQVIENKSYSQDMRLSVGALDSIPKHLICDIVDFAQRRTGCFLSIYEDSNDSLLRQLATHNIDVIISDHDVTNFQSNKFFSKKIIFKGVHVYGAPEFKKLKKNFPKSLNGVSCIVPTAHSKLRAEIDHFLHLHKIFPKFTTETQDTSLQKLLAVKGDGLVFLPDFASKELVQNKKLVKIGALDEVFIEYYLIYSKRVIENPVMELILNQDFNKMRLG